MGKAHDADRAFLARLREALVEDLHVDWFALWEKAWRDDAWKLRAIERELERRGEKLPDPFDFNF